MKNSKYIVTEKDASAERKQFAKRTEQELRKAFLANQRKEQDNKQSKEYAERAYRLAEVWVVALLLLIWFQFFLKRFGYGLGREEFIAVIGGLTGSVFGFWYLVGRHLFPADKPEKDE